MQKDKPQGYQGYQVELVIDGIAMIFDTTKEAYTYLGISFKLWTKWLNNKPSPRKPKPDNLTIKIKGYF